MATLKDRIQSILRYRVGKFDSTTLDQQLGIYAMSKSGVVVTERMALTLSTVYACVYKISSTMASMSLDIYEKRGNRTDIAQGHPSYLAINDPNDQMTAFEFWESIIARSLVWGVGLAYIERDNDGRPIALMLIDNQDVDYKMVDGKAVYIHKSLNTIPATEMLEICNLERKSPIQLHRENLGLAKASEQFGAEYFGSGGQMTGVLSPDQPLKSEQMAQLLKSWQGQQQAGTKVLPFGFKYNRVAISPDEAQFLQTRKFQAEEICRIYSVPPALVQLESQTTYNNVEQQNLMFARHTIAPWAKRIEAELDRKLLYTMERPRVYFKFNLNDLYRGDMSARATFYREMLQSGVMSINEVRQREDMNPVSNGGDEHLVQVNQITLSKIAEYSNKISNDASTE